MAMPETAVNKYNRFIFWENKVWLARQHFIMKFIPESIAKQEFSDHDFRLCVPAPDHGHIITSGFPVVNVCHEFSLNSN
jgi:hypothetical protein